MTRHTIQGWRPTSVTIQPASRATGAAKPATTAARWNHRDAGGSRLRHQRDGEPRAEGQEAEADADHHLESVPHDGHRRTFVGRNLVEALDESVGVVVGEERQPVRHLQAEVDPPVDVDASDGQRCAAPGLVEALDSGELHRLALGQETGRPVADADLNRGHHHRHA